MWDTLLGALVVAAILGVSAVATQLLARAMYNRCPSCHTLNARRRERCRSCEETLTADD